MLPPVRKVKLQENVFPTRWQTVLFRNYGYVPSGTLAAVLFCSVETIEREAGKMGIKQVLYDEKWLKNGYITIIRNNWYLLPYEQIIILLHCDYDRLAFLLKEEDFLSVKLGNFKPYCEEVHYTPLTAAQERKTRQLAAVIEPLVKDGGNYFNFFNEFCEDKVSIGNDENARIVHGYLTPCGDPFSKSDNAYLSDNLLGRYAACGVNGIWLHGVLSALSPYPFKPSLSANYIKNRRLLKKLIEKALRYGIKIYLYFNEPRALSIDSFWEDCAIMGHKEGGFAALCTSRKETEEYLYAAVKDLAQDLKGLGGFITITMSENLTHCKSQKTCNCPNCKDIPAEELAAKVNNIIAQAVCDSGSGAEVIANLWGWSDFMGWTDKQMLRGIEFLKKDISVMCVSEYGLSVEKGGVKSELTEYSVANTGPSHQTVAALEHASSLGHKVYAKIQVNNSWECSSVPYLPIFDLVYEHLKKLSEIKVKDYMLSWTLGGYPSITLKMVKEFSEKGVNFSLLNWYKENFGKNAEIVQEAVSRFCEGLRQYPISLQSLYNSPKNLGAANLWSLDAEEKISTMVGYSFDDYENWIGPYPYEIYILQLEKLLAKWQKGLDILQSLEQVGEIARMTRYAKAAYCHFAADKLQTEFSYCKRNLSSQKEKMISFIEEEERIAVLLADLQREDACIGFEASNHYFYTDRNLTEKILLLQNLKEKLETMNAEAEKA